MSCPRDDGESESEVSYDGVMVGCEGKLMVSRGEV